ncbi:MAG: carbamoyltransferase HypF [Acidobacteriaceae bacterium]|nr:carbamoyltransferase HypF [Acidobacteriaceae bacterium]
MPARRIRVRGIVQGVGFRPFVYRLAHANGLTGWVLNGQNGVEIHIEGDETALDRFTAALRHDTPHAAQISSVTVETVRPEQITAFEIRHSDRTGAPSTRISPDLPVCEDCLSELFNPTDRRYLYAYINCTNCGPRFSIIESLPYDRVRTTMRAWAMDEFCARQYDDPLDRRFHAQPIACPCCGPRYLLECDGMLEGGIAGIVGAAELLRHGRIIAVKGIGGYHLSCDALNAEAVIALRYRKFRREKPFAVMTANLDIAREIVDLRPAAEELLLSNARPIVLAPAKINLPGVAPDHHELGVMLPYAPLHHLLFAAGAPDILVMTSANRSSEPIAYRDDDARERLAGIADAFLIGERPITRRVDDSVARAGIFGAAVLRRSRGYAPGAVATFPQSRPVLALGVDLKNAITLAVDGQAFVSQHIGDLDQFDCRHAFQETVRDFLCMYRIPLEDTVIAHDLHPEYSSTQLALDLRGSTHIPVQHHRAHIASVLAEREAWERRVVGISFDGTGYGDDGRIWGGEFFTGSIAEGFTRVLHLRNAQLIGGDAAARSPVQCAAGFLFQLDGTPNLLEPPFHFPRRYTDCLELASTQLRTFETSSVGRLFDTAAALCGFTRDITFEGQAAIWLEELARKSPPADPYPFPVTDNTLDFRPLLSALIEDRSAGMDPVVLARRFHAALASALWQAAAGFCAQNSTDLLVLSGGVFQNELLLADIASRANRSGIEVWTNNAVPSNDGGISLGQAAIACFASQNISYCP